MRPFVRLFWLQSVLLLAALQPEFCRGEFRTWTAVGGEFKTEAEFIELREGDTVRLRLRSGAEKDIPLDKFSPADQEYARTHARKPVAGKSNRVAKLSREADRCDTAEQALQLYRIFRNDPQTTNAEREATDDALKELQELAEKKMVRMGSKWATPEEFRARRNKANSLMKQGLELLRLKQEEAFAAKFAEAAKVEPECIRADFMMGVLYSMLSSNYTKSKQYFDACAKREPNNVAVLNNVALAAMRRGDVSTAMVNWRKAVKLGPNQCIMQNLGRLIDQESQRKITLSKPLREAAVDLYATLLSMEKFEPVDFKRGWMWMFIDEESMSLARDENKDKPVESPAPKAAEDGAVVVSGGTGFVVFPHYLLTNSHVVEDGSSFDIQTSEGSKDKLLRATLVARSKKPDLAILHCPELEAAPIPIDPAVMRRGTDIMTFGYPEMFVLGASLKATCGVISAVPSSAVEDMYLFDAVVNHGNSGGPICDNRGNVVAVTTLLIKTEVKYGGGIPGGAALDFVSKHVPGFHQLNTSRQTLEWPAIDQRVSPSTVLIWTRSKNPGTTAAVSSAGFYEDRDCMVCNGLGMLRCGAPDCNGGMVIDRTSRKMTSTKCSVCEGKALVRCPVCSGTGIDPACVRVVPPAASTTPPPRLPPRRPPSTPPDPLPGNSPGNDTGPIPSSPPSGIVPANTSVAQPPSEGSTDNWKSNAPDDRFFDTLRDAVAAGKIAQTQQLGRGEHPFREVCKEGGLLIGLSLRIGQHRGYTTISAIQPIFWTKKGRDNGSYHGLRTDLVRHIYAKPGYAVGGLRIRHGEGIGLLSVMFMRIKGDRLDPDDSYESSFYGGIGGEKRAPTLIGGTGAIIVGVFGKTPSDPQSTFMGLGLVQVAAE